MKNKNRKKELVKQERKRKKEFIDEKVKNNVRSEGMKKE